MVKWSVEQVEAAAPSAAAMTAARPLATLTRWSGPGCDERAIWGSCSGSGSEPYDTMVDHVGVGFRCTCPSRKVPCKHAIALLLMWVADVVPPGRPDAAVDEWIHRRETRSRSVAPSDEASNSGAAHGADSAAGADIDQDRAGDRAGDDRAGDDGAGDDRAGDVSNDPDDDSSPDTDRDADQDRSRDERVEKMLAGLTELDRWLADRMRTGLADPALARYATWDDLAARLVDGRAGSLANRIRRLAGLVGASPQWQDEVLAELGLLHLLAQAGRRLATLPDPLADAVATTIGWQVRTADVLAGVPDTDEWVVAGRSDQREDRIEVRRIWLRGRSSGRWALVLSFAAYQQSLDVSLAVGTCVHADLHRYPGSGLRAIVGRRHVDPAAMLFPGEVAPVSDGRPPGQTIAAACDEVGSMLVAEPWLDRVPTTVIAAIGRVGTNWVLTDATGSLPIRAITADAVATLLAVAGGGAGGMTIDVTIEWTPHGVVPLAVHLEDRTIDIGPRADASFVGAA